MGAGIVGRAVTLAGQEAGVVRGVVAPLTQSVSEALDPKQAAALSRLFRQLDAGITSRAVLVFDGKGVSAAKHAALSLGDGGLVSQARAGVGMLGRPSGAESAWRDIASGFRMTHLLPVEAVR